jgi:hypothetical protein
MDPSVSQNNLYFHHLCLFLQQQQHSQNYIQTLINFHNRKRPQELHQQPSFPYHKERKYKNKKKESNQHFTTRKQSMLSSTQANPNQKQT